MRRTRFCMPLRKWLPLLEELRVWFVEKLPYIADAIPIHLLYEDLNVAYPLRPSHPALSAAGGTHAPTLPQ